MRIFLVILNLSTPKQAGFQDPIGSIVFSLLVSSKKLPLENVSASIYNTVMKNPHILPDLKPPSRSISIRMPLTLINAIKERAKAMDVAYQSLIKITLYNEFVAKDKKSRKSTSNQSSPYLKTKKSSGS